MVLRKYSSSDKLTCLRIFRGNCPRYFDQSEFALFEKYLDDLSGTAEVHNSRDHTYLVLEDSGTIKGCGGYYYVHELNESRLAWGMIDSRFHGQGLGTALFMHRKAEIIRKWPESRLTLGTSQHTYSFYQKMGFVVQRVVKSGYGPDLDRYDMELV